ncbi:MAG: hypothetical protein ABIO72_03115 [Patescibacteria group bacterium]
MRAREISIKIRNDASVTAVRARLLSIIGMESLDRTIPETDDASIALLYIAKVEPSLAEQVLSEIQMDLSVEFAHFPVQRSAQV